MTHFIRPSAILAPVLLLGCGAPSGTSPAVPKGAAIVTVKIVSLAHPGPEVQIEAFRLEKGDRVLAPPEVYWPAPNGGFQLTIGQGSWVLVLKDQSRRVTSKKIEVKAGESLELEL